MEDNTKNYGNLSGAVGKCRSRKCYICGFYGHIASNCRSVKTNLASKMYLLDLALSNKGMLKYKVHEVMNYYNSGKVMQDYTIAGMRKYIEVQNEELQERIEKENSKINENSRLQSEIRKLRRRLGKYEEKVDDAHDRIDCTYIVAQRAAKGLYEKQIQDLKNELALMKNEVLRARDEKYTLEETISRISTNPTLGKEEKVKVEIEDWENKRDQLKEEVEQIVKSRDSILQSKLDLTDSLMDLKEEIAQATDLKNKTMELVDHYRQKQQEYEIMENVRNSEKERERMKEIAQSEKKSWFSSFFSCANPEKLEEEEEPKYSAEQEWSFLTKTTPRPLTNEEKRKQAKERKMYEEEAKRNKQKWRNKHYQ